MFYLAFFSEDCSKYARRYRYKYIVDGVWHVDPGTTTELDELGFENNILTVDTAEVGLFLSKGRLS